MKRNPRKVRWTKAFRAGAGKEMTITDSASLETFEKRRNVPVRYDRELVGTTIKAMKRIKEIKARRERVEFKKRVLAGREKALSSSKETAAKEDEEMDTEDEEEEDRPLMEVDLVGDSKIKEVVKVTASKKSKLAN